MAGKIQTPKEDAFDILSIMVDKTQEFLSMKPAPSPLCNVGFNFPARSIEHAKKTAELVVEFMDKRSGGRSFADHYMASAHQRDGEVMIMIGWNPKR